MTNIRVIGKEEAVNEVPKPIELISYLENEHSTRRGTALYAKNFKNVELISKNYVNNFDLIFCYAYDRNKSSETYLCLGYWNDGVV